MIPGQLDIWDCIREAEKATQARKQGLGEAALPAPASRPTRVRAKPSRRRDAVLSNALPDERCPVTGKRCFQSEGSALVHADRWAESTSFRAVRAYFCAECESWHLTSKPRTARA